MAEISTTPGIIGATGMLLAAVFMGSRWLVVHRRRGKTRALSGQEYNAGLEFALAGSAVLFAIMAVLLLLATVLGAP